LIGHGNSRGQKTDRKLSKKAGIDRRKRKKPRKNYRNKLHPLVNNVVFVTRFCFLQYDC